jgi:hypothetical protein
MPYRPSGSATIAAKRSRSPAVAAGDGLNRRQYIKNGDSRAHPKADNELGASQETSARQSNKLKNSWGDRTPLELFLAGVQRLETKIGAMLCQRRVSDS